MASNISRNETSEFDIWQKAFLNLLKFRFELLSYFSRLIRLSDDWVMPKILAS